MEHEAAVCPPRRGGSAAAAAAPSLLVLALMALTVQPALSADDATPRAVESQAPPRPRIGLVLSGGGARGGAHIGVIKVLEELRIPVDYIAGTSMGSIVGGLYGSGLSPADMEKAIQEIDWDAVYRDVPTRDRISFRRKEDDRLALMPIEVGINRKGISGQSGFIAGQTVTFILRGLTLHTIGIERFDDLPIPYRAVAADLDTGEMVVLDHGDLATAMRASMSIPGAFTPVEIDGRMLVDGGIARNLPVDVAQTMGANRIIAVDVGTPPRGVKDQMSAVGVYSQTFNVLAKLNVKEQIELLGDDDLLIVPELGNVKSGDFGGLPTAIAAGEAAARGLLDRLRSFSASEEEFEAFRRRQRVDPSEALGEITIGAVEVRGVTQIDPKVITRRLETRPGSALNLATLQRDLERVHQSGEFEQVDFELVGEATNTRLIIDAKEKPYGPGYLRFGLGIDSSFQGDSDFRATIHHRRANVNRLGAEWKNILTIGDPLSLTTEFFQPLSPSGFWFVEPGAAIERRKREIFFTPGDPPEELLQDTWLGRLDAGVQFRNWGEIRIGAMRGQLDAEFATFTDLPDGSFELGGWTASATLDQLDNPFFPRRGNLTRATLLLSREPLGADLEYEKVQLRSTQAWSFGENTLVGGLDVGTDMGSDIPFFDDFELGGLFNLSGLRRGEMTGDVKGLFSLIYYWRLTKLGALGNLYLGGAAQAGGVWEEMEDAEASDLIRSGTVFFGLDSKLGPMYLAFGQAEGGFREAYFFLGRAF